MKQVLERPEIYHLYQRLGGFFGARLRAFQDYVEFKNVKRVFDIGCGPGHIVKYLSEDLDYIGFDTEHRYIDFANSHFGSRGRFVVRHFDATAADDYGQPDLILMNGVLHHLDDATASKILADAASMLPREGVLFALDGCFKDGQNRISRALIEGDRGRFVRTAPAYEALMARAFPYTAVAVRENLSWVPYTFAITRGFNAPADQSSVSHNRVA